jgi:hypothetical protein
MPLAVDAKHHTSRIMSDASRLERSTNSDAAFVEASAWSFLEGQLTHGQMKKPAWQTPCGL